MLSLTGFPIPPFKTLLDRFIKWAKNNINDHPGNPLELKFQIIHPQNWIHWIGKYYVKASASRPGSKFGLEWDLNPRPLYWYSNALPTEPSTLSSATISGGLVSSSASGLQLLADTLAELKDMK